MSEKISQEQFNKKQNPLVNFFIFIIVIGLLALAFFLGSKYRQGSTEVTPTPTPQVTNIPTLQPTPTSTPTEITPTPQHTTILTPTPTLTPIPTLTPNPTTTPTPIPTLKINTDLWEKIKDIHLFP